MVQKLNAAQEAWRSYLEAEVEFMYTATECGCHDLMAGRMIEW
jgi:hypothetical protein